MGVRRDFVEDYQELGMRQNMSQSLFVPLKCFKHCQISTESVLVSFLLWACFLIIIFDSPSRFRGCRLIVQEQCLLSFSFLPAVLPTHQDWRGILGNLATIISSNKDKAPLPIIPFKTWLSWAQELRKDPQHNYAVKVVGFLEHDFIRLASGAVILWNAKMDSPTWWGVLPLIRNTWRSIVIIGGNKSFCCETRGDLVVLFILSTRRSKLIKFEISRR